MYMLYLKIKTPAKIASFYLFGEIRGSNPDLLTASQARSQLRHIPIFFYHTLIL